MALTYYVARRVKRGLVTLYPAYVEARSLPGRMRFPKTGGYVREAWDGADPCRNSGRFAIFVHFDPKGAVHDFVLHAIAQLNSSGFRVHFLSNAPRLELSAVARLIPLCRKIYRRRNIGHDFGAYKDGVLNLLRETTPDTLLLTNDSVYGPFGSLDEHLARASPEQADVWGACDNWDFRYHLQSFFLIFHTRALTSPAFLKFWRQFPYVSYREWVIRGGEVALTQKLLSAGLRCRALFPYEDIVSVFNADTQKKRKGNGTLPRGHFSRRVRDDVEAGRPLNPTHYFWDLLINDMGFPFIKRDLLQRNPVQIPGLMSWRTSVARHGYDPELISDHLRLLARNHSV